MIKNIEIVSEKRYLKLIFKKEETPFGNYRETFKKEEAILLLQEIKKHIETVGMTDKISTEKAAYTEEISTYRQLVERTLDIGRKNFKNEQYMVLSLICYTEKEHDDNWIKLTNRQAVYLANLISGYIEHYFC